MIGAWEVASIIRFSTNGPVVMKQLANSASAANSQMGVLNGTVQQGEARLKGLQNRMSLVRTEQLAMFTGMASMGALALGSLSVAGISWAGQLQRAMTTVQISTGATGKSFEDLQNLVMHTSDITAQSAATIAQEMAVAATAGLSSSGRLLASFQQLAMAVDVLWLKGGQKEDPTNLMKSLVQFQHYFGAYGGDPKTDTGRKANARLQEVLNRTVDLEFMQPESVQKLVTQGKYFIPQAVRMGVDEDTIFRYMALLGQTGLLQGRGGTSFQQFLYRTLNPASISSTLSKAQARAGAEWHTGGPHPGGLGLLDKSGRLREDLLNKQGAPDVDKVISQLLAVQAKDVSAFGIRGRGTWMNDVKNFFQTQAAQVVNIFASEMSQNALKVIDETLNRMKKTGTVQEIWAAYMKTFLGAFAIFVTNLQNLVINVFQPLLPTLTTFFTDLAKRLSDFNDFLRAHQDIAGKIGWTILGLTAAFAALTVAGGVVLAANFLGIAAGLTALGEAAASLWAGLSGLGVGRAIIAGMNPSVIGKQISALIAASFLRMPALGTLGSGAVDATKLLGKIIGGALLSLFTFRGLGGAIGFGPGFAKALLGDLFHGLGEAFRILVTPVVMLGSVFISWLPRLAAILLRFVPIIGWALTAITLFNLAKPIIHWFMKNRGVIGYWIGYVFGWIGRQIVDMIGQMMQIVAGGISAMWHNMPAIALAAMGDGTPLQDVIEKYLRHVTGKGEGVLSGGLRGVRDAFGNLVPVPAGDPRMLHPHLTGDPRSQNAGDVKTTFNIGGLHFYGLKDPGDAKQAGQAVIQTFQDYAKSKGVDPRVTGSRAGSFTTSPSMPTPSGFHLNF